MAFEINSNISPKEMAEMNYEHAKKFEVALHILTCEIPARIIYLKKTLEGCNSKLAGLQTRKINFNLDASYSELSKAYEKYADDVLKYVGNYEAEILSTIDTFDRNNSENGQKTVDSNFFRAVPILANMALTLVGYFGNDNPFDDLPQLGIDFAGLVTDDDYTAVIGNLAYNTTEAIFEKINNINKENTVMKSGVAALILIAAEFIYNTQYNKKSFGNTAIHAVGDGVNLMASNIITAKLIMPMATKIGGTIGGLAGGAIAVGVSLAIDKIIDPIVDYFAGDYTIEGTEIIKNGGATTNELFAIIRRPTYYQGIGVDNKLEQKYTIYGMDVSQEYFMVAVQSDPYEAILNNYSDTYGSGDPRFKVLAKYLTELEKLKGNNNFPALAKNIRNNYQHSEKELIDLLLDELHFDPVQYVYDSIGEEGLRYEQYCW